jgi:HTH-type transcriptional regulator/antitoxin HigA
MINTTADYEAALAELERVWGAKLGTSESEHLNVLAMLKFKHFPIDLPNPIEAMKFRIEQQG